MKIVGRHLWTFPKRADAYVLHGITTYYLVPIPIKCLFSPIVVYACVHSGDDVPLCVLYHHSLDLKLINLSGMATKCNLSQVGANIHV